jgi:hypothetical protein
MDAEIPVTATRSTPVLRARGARASSRGWCCDFAPGVTRGNGLSGSSLATRGFITAHGRSIRASHAARWGVEQSTHSTACGRINHGSARQVPVSALARSSVEA